MACLLLCVVVVLVLPALTVAQSYASHIEYYQTSTVVGNYQCSYYTCGPYFYWRYWLGWYGWWPWYYNNYYWGWCWNYWSRCSYCYYTYSVVYSTNWRCQTGWTGCDCRKPICTPECSTGMSCTDQHVCQCFSPQQSQQCATVPCANNNPDCYPGSCAVSGSTCTCPPEFSGPNCETFLQKPDITTCSAKVYATSASVAEYLASSGNCAVYGVTPDMLWLGAASLTKIQVDFVASQTTPYTQPPIPGAPNPYINRWSIGINAASAVVTVVPLNGGPSRSGTVSCTIKLDQYRTYPKTQPCTLVEPWTELGTTLNSGDIIYINATASAGGNKWVGSLAPLEKAISGDTMVRGVRFKVDIDPPYHECAKNNITCTVPPIYVQRDTVKEGKITANFYYWKDDMSGINRYHFDVYFMSLNADGKLREVGDSLFPADITPVANSAFVFLPSKAGVYSIWMTVYDNANNSAMARKLVLYDPDSTVTSDPSKSITAIEASPVSGYKFISKVSDFCNGTVCTPTFSWKGLFQNTQQLSNQWLGLAQQWPQSKGLDDYQGNRTISAVSHINGIVSYNLSFYVDTSNNPYGGFAPGEWYSITPLDEKAQVMTRTQLQQGNRIYVWVKATDLMGNQQTVRSCIMVAFDSRPPTIDVTAFTLVPSQFAADDKTFLNVRIFDNTTGIVNITYDILDKSTGNTQIKTGLTVPVQKRLPPPLPGTKRKRQAGNTPCTPTDTTCYCTSAEDCYNYVQVLTINNCDVDRFAGHPLAIVVTAVNYAGQSVTGTVYLQDYAPMLCRISNVNTTGIIVGCVIGGLILILLIVLLVLMFLRYRNNKHPVPTRLRTMVNNFPRAISRAPHVDDNELYGVSDKADVIAVSGKHAHAHGNSAFVPDDIYVDESALGAVSKSKITPNQIHYDKTVAEGRFAVLKTATVWLGNEKKTVAAKMLQSGSSQNDINLLKLKIDFLQNRVTPHNNIVKFVGSVAEGPVLLLELCDMTLKDWLSGVTKVTDDVLENMLTISLNIARGVEHLHSQKVIHKRLAVRNVLLLKHQPEGLVAKLIGFGPSSEDVSESSGKTGASTGVAIPLKWLAPETLNSISHKERNVVYNEKTDAWSYAVTLWEIYSLGQTPYTEKKSTEVSTLLKSGYRMPCPDECPHEIFDSVVLPCWSENGKQRPDFTSICRTLTEIRQGTRGEEAGYYAVQQGQNNYNAGAQHKAAPTHQKKVQNAASHDDDFYDDAR